MLSPTDSSLSGTLNAVRQDVLQALVAGQSISAAAKTPPSLAPSSKPVIAAPNECSTNWAISPAWRSTLFDSC